MGWFEDYIINPAQTVGNYLFSDAEEQAGQAEGDQDEIRESRAGEIQRDRAQRLITYPQRPPTMLHRVETWTAALQPRERNAESELDPDTVERTLSQVRNEPEFQLSEEEQTAIRSLSPEEQAVYRTTLSELLRLRRGEISGSQYAVNVMQAAADVAGDRRSLFVDLVQMTFSDPDTFLTRIQRHAASGAGAHTAGSLIESAHYDLWTPGNAPGNTTEGGWNPNVVDTEDENSTVTHHFGEFLRVGNRSRFQLRGMWAADACETLNGLSNRGDIRNGYFGVMLGYALREGQISPQDAVRMTEWAMTRNGERQANPPWGSTETETEFLSWSDYDFSAWVHRFNQAHPEAPIEDPS